MNKIILVGNTTKETESKDKISKTSIAVKRDFKNTNGEYETDFFDLVAFGNQSDFLKSYVHKGDKICISGRLQTRQYDASDGTKKKVYEIVVDTIENLTPKKQEQELEQVKDEDLGFYEDEIPDDDLPF